ncbi:MAG: dihydropteroate synthase [Chloroflexi bacterium]|jgi:dihydropteroate synthase|nr:dihydropteroate synthase [Chloroflexota bacterium]MBT5627975.1 dihydropteroate synthase [Chloroflexota bacterium]
MPLNSQQPLPPLAIDDIKFVWGERTFVMGIVNATPDSFSGDGILPSTGDIQAAVDQALRMEDEGADIIDVGGESTRPASLYPDAKPVDSDDEIRRVVPIIEALAGRLDVPISIDTRKASVVVAAVDVGAAIANDVSMLRDPEMAGVVASTRVPVIVSHIRPGGHKGDVFDEVVSDLEGAIDQLIAVRVGRSKIIVDPGLGFAKTAEQSLELMRNIFQLRNELGLPVLVGSSRKSFIGSVTGEPVEDRLFGTAATIALAIQGGADIVRVHDVKQMASVVKMSDAIVRGSAEVGTNDA